MARETDIHIHVDNELDGGRHNLNICTKPRYAESIQWASERVGLDYKRQKDRHTEKYVHTLYCRYIEREEWAGKVELAVYKQGREEKKQERNRPTGGTTWNCSSHSFKRVSACRMDGSALLYKL